MPILKQVIIQQLIHRILQLQSDSKGRWGKMTIEEMMVHCTAGIQMGLGQLPSKERVGPLRAAILRLLYVDLFPFPKSATAPPEINISKKLKTRQEFENARQSLIQEVKKLEAIPDNYEFPFHPYFRKLSNKQWSKVTYKHLDHHLRQFGV